MAVTASGKSSRSTVMSAVTMAASNAFTESSEIDCTTARTVTALVQMTSAATGNYVNVLPVFSPDSPDSAAPTWWPFADVGDTATEVDLTSVPATIGFTRFDFSSRSVSMSVLATPAADGATDVQRISIVLNSAPARRMKLLIAQGDASGSRPIVTAYLISSN